MNKFYLSFPVIDSGEYTVTDLENKPILFNSVEEAKEFRDKNDYSNINEEHHYWLNSNRKKGGTEVDLSLCSIVYYEGNFESQI